MPKILVIEDDDQVRRLLRQILEDQDYEVVEARDGDEGISQYRQEQPDLLISDLVMPGKDGLMAIQEILQEYPRANVICISGGPRGKPYWLPLAKRAGAFHTLKKPIEPSVLISAVRNCLNSRN